MTDAADRIARLRRRQAEGRVVGAGFETDVLGLCDDYETLAATSVDGDRLRDVLVHFPSACVSYCSHDGCAFRRSIAALLRDAQ